MRRWVFLGVFLGLALAGRHVVAPGDTLFSLARLYGTTVEELKRLNGLDSDLIKVGQVLIVPGEGRRPEIVELVRPYLGAPYRFGGTGEGGFDCSGLVLVVYQKLGVSLPRTAAEMYQELLPVKEPRPGDLVFFSFGGVRPDHVGIYLGGGEFVHASNRGVVIERLDAPWYRRAYIGARRVLLSYDVSNERAQDHPAGAAPR